MIEEHRERRPEGVEVGFQVVGKGEVGVVLGEHLKSEGAGDEEEGGGVHSKLSWMERDFSRWAAIP